MTDFTLYVASRDDLAAYTYAARPDILSDYPLSKYVNYPRDTNYIEVRNYRSQSEVTATAYVEAMRKLGWVSVNMLGWGKLRGKDSKHQWTLKVVMDIQEVDERVEAILRRVREFNFDMEVVVDVESARRETRLSGCERCVLGE